MKALILASAGLLWGCTGPKELYFDKIDRNKASTCLMLKDFALTSPKIDFIKKTVYSNLDNEVPFSDDYLCFRRTVLMGDAEIIKVSIPKGNHSGPLWFLNQNMTIFVFPFSIQQLKKDTLVLKSKLPEELSKHSELTKESRLIIFNYFVHQSRM